MKEVRVSFHTRDGVATRIFECHDFNETPAGSIHLKMPSGESVAFFARGAWTAAETVEAEDDPA